MKALVVDDDIVSRMALMDLLSLFGMFELVEAADGEAAWTLIARGLRPAICLCDVRMPHLSGIELLQRMRTAPLTAHLPVVLVSCASDRDTVLQAIKLGAAGYILKPFEVSEARSQLEKIFRVTLDKLVENPLATLKRLNIGPDRLLAYLNAFQGQLAAGAQQITEQLKQGDTKGAVLRIDTLHTGCLTLGLWHVAGQLDVLRRGPISAREFGAVLADILEALDSQALRVRGHGRGSA